MNTHADNSTENKSQSIANIASLSQGRSESTFEIIKTNPEFIAQRKFHEMMNNSIQVKQLAAIQKMIDSNLQENQLTYQLHPLKEASSTYQPSDKRDEERSQKERIRGETERKDGSIIPDTLDQEPLPHEVLVLAEYNEELNQWLDVPSNQPLTGSYDFIMHPDKESAPLLWMVEERILKSLRQDGEYGHVSLARLLSEDGETTKEPEELAVAYAGGISFIDGHLIEWNGASGHFTPPDLKQQDWSDKGSMRNLALEAYNSNPHEDIIDSEIVEDLQGAWTSIEKAGNNAFEKGLAGGYLSSYAQKELKDVLKGPLYKQQWGKTTRGIVLQGYIEAKKENAEADKGAIVLKIVNLLKPLKG